MDFVYVFVISNFGIRNCGGYFFFGFVNFYIQDVILLIPENYTGKLRLSRQIQKLFTKFWFEAQFGRCDYGKNRRIYAFTDQSNSLKAVDYRRDYQITIIDLIGQAILKKLFCYK